MRTQTIGVASHRLTPPPPSLPLPPLSLAKLALAAAGFVASAGSPHVLPLLWATGGSALAQLHFSLAGVDLLAAACIVAGLQAEREAATADPSPTLAPLLKAGLLGLALSQGVLVAISLSSGLAFPPAGLWLAAVALAGVAAVAA